MQTVNATQTVYNYLLQSNNTRTAASIAANTQLTVQQVSSALQHLQKRKLVVCVKQQYKNNMYSAVSNATAQFNAVRIKTAAVHSVTQHAASIVQQRKQQSIVQQRKQQSIVQRFMQLVKRMFA